MEQGKQYTGNRMQQKTNKKKQCIREMRNRDASLKASYLHRLVLNSAYF